MPPLLREVKWEAEGGDKLRVKESRQLGDLSLMKP
jgi:hypothetical protein